MKPAVFLFAIVSLLSIYTLAAPPADEGKSIFLARCASCHNVHKTLVGPALAGISDRRPTNWIVRFVQSSQSMIKSGDKEAVALFAQYNNIPMPDHADLSAEKIKGIIDYITAETKTAAATEKPPFARMTKLRPAYVPLAITDYPFFISLAVVVLLLVLGLLALVKVKEYDRARL